MSWRVSSVVHACTHTSVQVKGDLEQNSNWNRMFFLLRGKGPLKNTSNVINAAKKIAEAGSRMDKLGRKIADQVSSTRMTSLFSVLTMFHLKNRIPLRPPGESQQCVIYLPAKSLWMSPWSYRRHHGTVVNLIPTVRRFIFLESSYSWSRVTMTGSQASWK